MLGKTSQFPFATRAFSPLAMLLLLSFSLVSLPLSNLSADVVHNEAVDGDLSDDNLTPTDLGIFAFGSSQILGTTTNAPLDRDFWTFEIMAGQQLDSVTLDTFETTEDQSFFAVAAGDQVTSLSAAALLGSTLVGSATGRVVGDDVLDDLGNAILGGTGFTGPLGAGEYTFWFQETAADTSYAFSFNVSAVPEPTSMAFLGLGATFMLLRRRR